MTAALEMKLDDLTAVEKKTTLGAPVVSYRLIRYYASCYILERNT